MQSTRMVSLCRSCSFAALAAVAAFAGPVVAQTICFNNITWGPPTVPGPPDDQHWSFMYRFDYENGTPIPNATMLAGSFGGKLYLQWTVRNASGFSNSDRVVFAFRDSPTIADPSGRRRMLVVQPNCDGTGV